MTTMEEVFDLMATRFADEVIPIGIFFLDEANLPRPIPLLEPFFSANRSLDIGMLLEIDQAMNFVLFCKAVDETHLVFVYPAYEIVCHADIERAAQSPARI